MKIINLTILNLCLLLVIGCSNKPVDKNQVKIDSINNTLYSKESGIKKFEFGKTVNLKDLKKTEIVPTLENSNAEDKNTIYTSLVLLTWQEVKKLLKKPIILSHTNSNDFILLNNSNSYLNSLNPGEYESEIDIGDGIIIKSFFSKALPFNNTYNKMSLMFQNQKVLAFGFERFDMALAEITKIYYYESDDRFVFGIDCKETDHEIIFAKGIDMKGNLKSAYDEIENLRQKGKQDTIEKNNWKYFFDAEDKLIIPMINYNLEKNYSEIENQLFKTSDNSSLQITLAYQNIAFCMNEYGIAIQDNVWLGYAALQESEHKPKLLILDKPFVLILKRKDSDYPYFAMKIRNTELMVKK
jgi:hypothetical protein